MTPEHKEYRRRKAELDTRYKSPFAERWFGWWRNGPDRFAFLIALFTFALFAATAGLWLATNSLVEDARDSGRAWIGPADARLAEGIQKDKAVKIAIQYTNTGRQPAPYVLLINGKVFGEKEWEDGTAVQNIIASQKNCMGIDALNNPIARVAYPTSGFSSFQMTFDSEYRYLPENMRFTATQQLVDGTEIVALKGCFVYKTINAIRHSSFCYFYQAKQSDPQHLAYCTVGQEAD